MSIVAKPSFHLTLPAPLGMDQLYIFLPLGFLAFLGIAFVSLAVWWLVVSRFGQTGLIPKTPTDALVEYQWLAILSLIATAPCIVFSALFNALFSLLFTFWNNLLPIAALLILSSASLVWMEYHPMILESYTAARQCYAEPILNYFLLPVFNICVMAYDVAIPVVNFYVNLHAAAWFLFPILLFECILETDMAAIWAAFTELFAASFLDLRLWLNAGPTTAFWDLTVSLNAFGDFVDTWVPALTCFCAKLTPLFVSFASWARLPSFHMAVNCIWNVWIRILQLPIRTIENFPTFAKPNFTNITLAICCAVEATGDTAEDTLFLILDMLWGFIGNSAIPPELMRYISVPWSHVITNPICGITKAANVTINIFMNLDSSGVFKSDGSGIRFFQFDFCLDEFIVGAEAFGALFYIIDGNKFQALVTLVLTGIVEFIKAIFEWIPGVIFYFNFGGATPPLQPAVQPPTLTGFLHFWIPNYWIRPEFDIPSTTIPDDTGLSLATFYLLFSCEALGQILAQINPPFGCVVEHVLKAFIQLISLFMNFVFFFFTIITFDPNPLSSSLNINFDPFFQELFYLAGCLGDFLRQFSDLNCSAFFPDDANKNLYCCMGFLIELGLDTFVEVVRQITQFFFDLVAVPTGQINLCIFGFKINANPLANVTDFPCVHIPDMTTALYELEDALCEFACAVCAIFPPTLLTTLTNCQFAPVPVEMTPTGEPLPTYQPNCAKISTCLGQELCNLLKIFTLPLQILNQFFVQTVQGQAFNGFIPFLQVSVKLILTWFTNLQNGFGVLLDCLLCALLHTPASSPNCDSLFYQVLRQLSTLEKSLLQIITGLLINVFKLVLQLIIGIFGGNPIGAIVNFVVGFFTEVLGGLGATAVKFLVQLFDGIGLGFVGNFIQLLWQGFCPILQTIINIVVIELKIITFGAVPIKFVNFCCTGPANCTVSGGGIKRWGEQVNGTAEIDGVVYMFNNDQWMNYLAFNTNLSWTEGTQCNMTINDAAQQGWSSLEEYQQGQVFYCMMQYYWPLRNDNQPTLEKSFCDALVYEYVDYNWTQLSILEKRSIMKCVAERLYVDGMRVALNISWLPQDILTNEWRKYYFMAELSRGLLIYYQYYQDQMATSAVLQSPSYQAQWASIGLNTSFYGQLNSTEAILAFRAQYKLADYFHWNGNASQLDATEFVTTTGWNIVDLIIQTVRNTTTALADNVTNPATYIQFAYTLNNPSSGVSSSVNAIMGNVLDGIQLIAEQWSNPANLKKREEVKERTKMALSRSYDLMQHQVRLMSAEWLDRQLHEENIMQGHCDQNETVAFLYQYQKSIYGLDEDGEAEHSVIYRLSNWWRRFEWPEVNNVSYKARDPKYSRTVTMKRDETGEPEMSASNLFPRLRHYSNVFFSGTPASNKRLNGITSVYTSVKDQIYFEMVKLNMRYFKGTPPPPPVQAAAAPSLTQSTSVESDIDALSLALQASGKKHYRLRPENERERQCRANIAECPRLYESKELEVKADRARKRFTQTILFADQNFIHLNCTSGIPQLCSCLYLDQLVTRVFGAINVLIYYETTVYPASLNAAIQDFTYLFNDGAQVVVGDSPSNSVLWPYVDRPWAVIIGDDTPNKLRFHDIENMTSQDLVNHSFANSSLVRNVDTGTINGQVFEIIRLVFDYFLNLFYNMVVSIFSDQGKTEAESTAFFLVNWFIICDWNNGTDYNGQNKRFSIGEMMFIYLALFIIITMVMVLTIGYNVLSIITGTALSFMLFLFTFLSLTYNWSALCWEGLPVLFMRDIMYFFTHTLFAKCMWFWSGLVIGPYNNNNCFSCATAMDLTMVNCVDVGFNGLPANIIFMLQVYAPSVLDWLRNTTTPLYWIYQIPAVNQAINYFATVNMGDPVQYAQHMTCNYFVTLLPNATIFAFYIIVLSLFYPLFVGGLLILFYILSLLWAIFLVGFLMLEWIFVYLNLYPFHMTGTIDHVLPGSDPSDPTTYVSGPMPMGANGGGGGGPGPGGGGGGGGPGGYGPSGQDPSMPPRRYGPAPNRFPYSRNLNAIDPQGPVYLPQQRMRPPPPPPYHPRNETRNDFSLSQLLSASNRIFTHYFDHEKKTK